MKKCAVLSVLLMVVCYVFAQVTFDRTPVIIKADNYYDYQIGGFNGYAIEKEQTTGNLFMTYMFKAHNSSRKQLYAYINPQGQIIHEGTLTDESLNEGYGSLAIDQNTGHAFFVWHDLTNDNSRMQIMITAIDPLNGFRYPCSLVFPSGNDLTYGWPVIYIGASPLENKRRIHVFANMEDGGNTAYCSRVKYAYADYDDSLFNGYSLDLVWNYSEFSYFNDAHNSLTQARPHPTFAVKDNRVVIGGYIYALEGITSPTNADSLLYAPHDTFFLVNENYGSGEFTTHTYNTARSIPSPVNSNGQIYPADQINYKIEHQGSSHVNMTFTDSRVQFPSIYACTFEEIGIPETRFNWPLTSYVKTVAFDFDTQSVFVKDLEPKGAHPQDGLLTIPWDFNEDEVPDSFDDQGNWEFQKIQYPYPHHNTDDSFHNAYLRQSNMNSNQVYATVWNDTRKAYEYYVNNDTTYQQFANTPEVYIAYSYGPETMGLGLDIMNAVPGDEHFEPELANLRPVNFHIAKEVDVVSPAGINRVNMMFLNDKQYGTFLIYPNDNAGADVMFASITFNNYVLANDPTIKPELVMLKQNYPNPFNPSTQIDFELKKTDHIKLSIYNIKGQLVKTLADDYLQSGSHTYTWNGEDQYGQRIGSGVYFYRLETSGYSQTKKMLLIK